MGSAKVMARNIFIVAILLLPMFAGCGGDGAEGGRVVPVFPVTGKLEYAGSPLSNAVISFAPLDGQPVATGRTNSNGEYALTTYDFEDGAAEGKYKVIVSKQATKKGNGEEEHSEDSEYEPPTHAEDATGEEGSLLPSEYGTKDDTPLKATVDPSGDNVFDFKL